jgi:hypothetical protein
MVTADINQSGQPSASQPELWPVRVEEDRHLLRDSQAQIHVRPMERSIALTPVL